jgi:hypothetical protein
LNFQTDNKLQPTGTLDDATQARLDSLAKEPKPSPRQPVTPVSVAQHTLSDQPISDVSKDRLGMRGSVQAVVNFLRSEETLAPLAIGICAQWGRGKTSFMRMVGAQLSHKRHFQIAKVRFATAWFNPWMYDDEKQVWAALLSVIIRNTRNSLGLTHRMKFEWLRFWRNLVKRFTLRHLLQLVFIVGIGVLFFWLALAPDMREISLAFARNVMGKEAVEKLELANLGMVIPLVGAFVLVQQLYSRVIKGFNQGLLEHLKQTNFRDKIGTLSEFEDEMRILNNSIPANLKIVVFIDDLDRCKPQILSEIIEALQLLEVSRKCIYILGMDMHIVVKTIESDYAKLNPEVDRSLNNIEALEHGAGYRFLEKIIQVRLSIPGYEENVMKSLASSLGAAEIVKKVSKPLSTQTTELKQEGGVEKAGKVSKEPETPKDSPEVVNAIEHYGSLYFRNPRRLKRWINSFRLHVYLASAAGKDIPVERLARFLVLCEKWPGLVAIFRANPNLLNGLIREDLDENQFVTALEQHEAAYVKQAFETLKRDMVNALFKGKEAGDEINGERLLELCDWYDFRFYR